MAYGNGANYFASDVTAVLKYTREVSYLEDGEMAVITPEKTEVYNSFLERIEKKHETVDWDISAAEKGGYEHFMFKEIMEQPKAVQDTVSTAYPKWKSVL